MISKDIIKLASSSNNFGLKNDYSHKTSLKNSLCGDKITLELIVKNKKVSSMRYETEACISVSYTHLTLPTSDLV